MPTSCLRRQSFRLLLTLALAFSLTAGSWPRPQRAADHVAVAPADVPALTNAKIDQRAKEAYGKLGISFEENRGQADARVRFLSRGGGATVFLADDGASFVLGTPRPPAGVSDKGRLRDKGSPEALARRERPQLHAVHMKFEGANPRAEVSGERELEGKVNYFRSRDPSKWRTNVKTYGAVRYRGLYEGVDLVYYGNEQGEMEYDFVVAPGADPSRISLKVEGAKALEVDASGNLVINTPAGEMRHRRPVVYQEVGGARREVEGGYAVEPNGRVRFRLGEYDKGAPLVIDPVLQYSVFVGFYSWDVALGITSDSSGNAYITGMNEVSDITGFGSTQIIVAKLNAHGGIVYSTYLEGSPRNVGYDIAADAAGNAYITGYTGSEDFPVVNAYQDTLHGDMDHGDAFVTKLNPTGSELIYSTYLGGNSRDAGTGIAVDAAGNAYVTGVTTSTDFPTKTPVQGALSGSSDSFVTKFTPDGSALVYSTYLGGSGEDDASGIALDSAGRAYVTGTTRSTDFPTVNAFQGANAGDADAFASKLNAAGSAFVYSTYLGGGGRDSASGIALDSAGRAYVAGTTRSTDFPTVNALQGANAGEADAFVTRFKADGSALVFSTYLGGSNFDGCAGIGVDSWGHATVGGQTNSADFPLKNPLPGENVGNADAYLARIRANGSGLLYSTYVGTDNHDIIGCVTADPSGNAYLGGSSDNPQEEEESFAESTNDALIIKLNVTPFIKGRVVTQGAAGPVGVPWVTVRLTGAQTATKLTDARGYYSFTGLTQGEDYAVTVSKNNLSFVPPGRTYDNMFADAPDADFTVPSLSVGDVSVTEGNAGEATVSFAVRLQPASPQPVTVNYQTIDGSTNPAAAGSDYTALPLTQLTFAPGETAKAVYVKVRGDTLDEAKETFRLLLSAPTGALISDKEGLCVVNDNDPAPSLSVNDVSVTEGDADVTATFTVTLSAASGQTVKITYRTANGTAAAPADYAAVGLTTLTFAPGETAKTVSVTVKGDESDEAAETFKLLLSSAVNATVAAAAGTCAITDDD